MKDDDLGIAERRWKFNQVLANLMQEGFIPNEKYLELHEKTITGELTLDEAFAQIAPQRPTKAGFVVCQSEEKGTWYWCLQAVTGEVVEEQGDYQDEESARIAATQALTKYEAQRRS